MNSYDLVIVGSGFSASFFLLAYLRSSKPKAKILVLERGMRYSQREQIKFREQLSALGQNLYRSPNSPKPWLQTPFFGGGSNCWWACTPRMLPADFRCRTLYNVGQDWPITYEELEPYYQQAEEIMLVSGEASSLLPRSAGFPQNPHRFSEVDKHLKHVYGDRYVAQATARARNATQNRPACCGSGVCGLCPIDAKFTVSNELSYLFEDPRVELRLGARAQELHWQNDKLQSIVYQEAGQNKQVKADLFVLAANAICNPHILLRSGLQHEHLGRNLCEQVSVLLTYDLGGIKAFGGSTSITANGYMLYDGERRRTKAACLIESVNIPSLRLERGRLRNRARFKCIFEVQPQAENRVRYSTEHPDIPLIDYHQPSNYTSLALRDIEPEMEHLLSSLAIEKLVGKEVLPTEGHIIGTTRMSERSAEGVVDKNLVHHQLRNLVVLGSSVFPSCPPANPTLSICALSLFAAHKLE